jgi:hypothetical protein
MVIRSTIVVPESLTVDRVTKDKIGYYESAVIEREEIVRVKILLPNQRPFIPGAVGLDIMKRNVLREGEVHDFGLDCGDVDARHATAR